jgi:hypothetical protein
MMSRLKGQTKEDEPEEPILISKRWAVSGGRIGHLPLLLQQQDKTLATPKLEKEDDDNYDDADYPELSLIARARAAVDRLRPKPKFDFAPEGKKSFDSKTLLALQTLPSRYGHRVSMFEEPQSTHTGQTTELKFAKPKTKGHIAISTPQLSPELAEFIRQQVEETVEQLIDERFAIATASVVTAIEVPQSTALQSVDQQLLAALQDTLRHCMGRQDAQYSDIAALREMHDRLSARVEALGESLAVLRAKVYKDGEHNVVMEALKAREHIGTRTFFNCYIHLIERDAMTASMVESGKFKFNFGRNGIVIDLICSILDIIPAGISMAVSNMVRILIDKIQARSLRAASKKILHGTGGTMDNALKLATGIAIALLNYNGQQIDFCSKEQAEKLAEACAKATFRYIKRHHEQDIYAEDIVLSILKGEVLNRKDTFICSMLVALNDNGDLMYSRRKMHSGKDKSWLSDVVEAHTGVAIARPAARFVVS